MAIDARSLTLLRLFVHHQATIAGGRPTRLLAHRWKPDGSAGCWPNTSAAASRPTHSRGDFRAENRSLPSRPGPWQIHMVTTLVTRLDEGYVGRRKSRCRPGGRTAIGAYCSTPNLWCEVHHDADIQASGSTSQPGMNQVAREGVCQAEHRTAHRSLERKRLARSRVPIEARRPPEVEASGAGMRARRSGHPCLGGVEVWFDSHSGPCGPRDPGFTRRDKKIDSRSGVRGQDPHGRPRRPGD
jgi:hypothetical protein